MFDKLTQLLMNRTGGMGQKPAPMQGAGMGESMGAAPKMMPSVDNGFINKLFAKFRNQAPGQGLAQGFGKAVPQIAQGMGFGMQKPMTPPVAAPDTPMPESPMSNYRM
jgi:hypothetical protein